ncbi:hypothetical protein WJX73_008952 [Symbiochloris irregularis]|uniref:50S ribosomal protein L22, chloroplastic n=1 Tax=Symbiochloris irregularis TaxID=706552 RepID=A0AAW1NWT9_9CHLO
MALRLLLTLSVRATQRSVDTCAPALAALPQQGLWHTAVFPCASRALLTHSHAEADCHLRIGTTPSLHNAARQSFATVSPVTQANELATADQVNPLLQTPSPQQQGQAATSAPRDYARAVLRGTQISPKKLNYFAAVIRRLHVDDALSQCELSPLKAAKICHKVLASAMANATNNHGMTADRLYIDLVEVGKARYLKRIRYHGRGRSGSARSYYSHLTVVLREGDSSSSSMRPY